MMRKTLRASVLVLALCAPAFAGDIPMPPAPEPPPPSVTAANQVTGGETLTTESNSLTETVLSVITSVVALL
jgi:hypothetical protein